MHVLNVRFKNLNSLAGEWFIDFERPEYQDEGSFLITGPTGAGKTTILDAICLALYGRTPRETISNLQNELMTRHTKDCFAEVTFACKSGRYRTKCEHSRTRAGSSTPFRTPYRELARENGEIVVSGIRETTSEVEKLAGLKYDQFVRAILLAQGDFDALLKADENNKAQILENLTNTSIYRKLAGMAHQRNQGEQEKLAALQEKVKNLALPTEEEEKELRQKLTEYAKVSGEIAEALEICNRNLAWRERVDNLWQEAGQLEQEQQKLAREQTDFAPKLVELENALKAAPMQDKYERREHLRAELDEQRKEIAKNAGELQILEQKAQLCKTEIVRANANLARQEQSLEAAAPDLAKARELDAQLKAHVEALYKQREETATQEAHAQVITKQLQNKEREKVDRTRDFEDAEAWLNEHGQAEWLVENLNALKGQIAALARAREDTEHAARKYKRDQKEAADAEKNLAEIRKKRSEAAAGIKAAEGALQDIEARKAAMLGNKSAEDWHKKQTELTRRSYEAKTFRKIQDFAHLLRDGEPCPLCGSREHPMQAEPEDEDTLKRESEEIGRLLDEARKLETEVVESAKVLESRRHKLGLLNGKIEGAEQQKELCQRVLAESAANLQKCSNVRSELEKELTPQLEPFAVKIDDADAQKILDHRLEVWRKCQKQRDEIARNLQSIEVELSGLRSGARQATEVAEASRRELGQLQQAVESVREMRQILLGARQADAEEARLKGNVAAARAERDKEIAAQTKIEAELAAAGMRKEMLAKNLQKTEEEKNLVAAKFAETLFACGMTEVDFRASLKTEAQIKTIQKRNEELQCRQNQLEGQIKANAAKLDAEQAKELTPKDSAALRAEKEKLKERQDKIRQEQLEKEMLFRKIEDARKQAEELATQIAAQGKECERWQELKKILGPQNGKEFQGFAQSITLDILLRHANRHLAGITDRYQFQRQSKKDENLNIAVIDNYQAGEVRAISNLSGGETFIASLALALGLSSMAGKNAVMGSLFLDEGFGTLDPKTLCDALDAIASLRMEGKLIGIISHVEALKEKIATHIQIVPNARGRSEIRGPGCERL